MDPNLIHVDWERTFEALTLIVILAFFVERSLAVIFESRFYIEYFDRDGVKELSAIVVSVAACVIWKLDAVGMIILTETTTVPGYIVTGLVVAGGSKASIKLFHDLLKVKSTSYDLRHDIRAGKSAEAAQDAATEAAAATNLVAAETAARKAEAAAKRAKAAAGACGSAVAGKASTQAEKAAKAARDAVKKLQGPDK